MFTIWLLYTSTIVQWNSKAMGQTADVHYLVTLHINNSTVEHKRPVVTFQVH